MTGIFQKLFGKKNKITQNSDQAEQLADSHYDNDNGPQKSMSFSPKNLPQLSVGYGYSVGRQREHNEDALFTFTTNLITDTNITPFGLFIIADGMGGHQYGEVASAVSIRAMSNYVINKLFLPWLNQSHSGGHDSIHEVLQEGLYEAHRMIVKDAPGGGTTLTAALVFGNRVTISHVGDSRAYLIQSERETKILTHDHSLVKRLQELGQLTAEEAANHPQRNVLYRALGQGEPFEPDIDTYTLPSSGYLLICSDGLWGVISQNKILDVIEEFKDPQKTCQSLVDAANAAGGPDNISVILVRLPDEHEG